MPGGGDPSWLQPAANETGSPVRILRADVNKAKAAAFNERLVDARRKLCYHDDSRAASVEVKPPSWSTASPVVRVAVRVVSKRSEAEMEICDNDSVPVDMIIMSLISGYLIHIG
jgi:hypothetical protein